MSYENSISHWVSRTALAALALGAGACSAPDRGVGSASALEETAAVEQAVTVDLDPRKSILITDEDIVSQFTLKEVLDRLSNGRALELFHQMFATELRSKDDGAGSGPNCDDLAPGGVINGWPAECPRAEGQEALRDPFSDPQASAAYMATTLSNRFDLAPADGKNCGEYRINFARRSGIGLGGGLTRLFIAFEARLPNPTPSLGLAGCQPVISFWRGLSELTPAERASELRRFYLRGLSGFKPVIDVGNFGDTPGLGGQVRVNQFLFIEAEIGDWSAREFLLLRQPSSPTLGVTMTPSFNKDVPARELFNPSSRHPLAAPFQRDVFPLSIERLALQDMNAMNYVAPIPKDYNSGDSHMAGGSNPRLELFNDYGETFGSGASDFRSRIQARLSAIGSSLTPNNIIERATSLSCNGCHNLSQEPQRQLGLPAAFPKSLNFVHVGEDLIDIPGEPSRKRFVTSDFIATVLPYRAQVMRDFLAPVYGFERTAGWSSPQAALALVSAPVSQGQNALSIIANQGYSEITSVPASLTGVGAIGSNLKIDLDIPTVQTNPGFAGLVSVWVSVPSARINNVYLGQVSLAGLPRGKYSTLSFALPANVQRNLGYGVTDASFKIALNVSANPNPYFLDNLRFQ